MTDVYLQTAGVSLVVEAAEQPSYVGTAAQRASFVSEAGQNIARQAAAILALLNVDDIGTGSSAADLTASLLGVAALIELGAGLQSAAADELGELLAAAEAELAKPTAAGGDA